MFRQLALAFAATITLHCAPSYSEDQWPDAYSRRGFKLGMTLDAFRLKPYPETGNESTVSVVCSDEDRSSDPRYSSVQLKEGSLIAAGAIRCAYYFTDADMPAMDMAAGISLLDEPVSTSFVFLPDQDGTKRLARIDTIGPIELLARLLSALEQAYGGQPEINTIELQNGFGARSKAATYAWSNSSSAAKVHDFGGTEPYFLLEHSLTSLIKRMEDAEAERAASDADKL